MLDGGSGRGGGEGGHQEGGPDPVAGVGVVEVVQTYRWRKHKDGLTESKEQRKEEM